MSGEEEENAAELKIGEEFLKAKCLMNAEVALILDRKLEQLQQMSDDPNQISQVFEKSMQYVKRFSRYKNPDAVRQIREILSRNKLAEFELCVLGNLCPETVEEAMAMVPSIKCQSTGIYGKKKDPLGGQLPPQTVFEKTLLKPACLGAQSSMGGIGVVFICVGVAIL